MQYDVRFCNNYALNALRGRATHKHTGMIIFLDMENFGHSNSLVSPPSKWSDLKIFTECRSFSCLSVLKITLTKTKFNVELDEKVT